MSGATENTGVENAGVEKAGVDSRGGKCQSKSYGTPNRGNVISLVCLFLVFLCVSVFFRQYKWPSGPSVVDFK